MAQDDSHENLIFPKNPIFGHFRILHEKDFGEHLYPKSAMCWGFSGSCVQYDADDVNFQNQKFFTPSTLFLPPFHQQNQYDEPDFSNVRSHFSTNPDRKG